MSQEKIIVATDSVNQLWLSAIKESGHQYTLVKNPEEALHSTADFFIIDAKKNDWATLIPSLKTKFQIPLLAHVSKNIDQTELKRLKKLGVDEVSREDTPADEMMIRFQWMLHQVHHGKLPEQESRSAKRIWFQQSVNFKIFDKNHSAWSTTLSRTGVFIRTTMSFPLYSSIQLKFNLWGDDTPFESEGVIVRQEAEGPIKGFGVIFQGLSGSAVKKLETFLSTVEPS